MRMYAGCVQTTSLTIYYANLIQICQLCVCYKNYKIMYVVGIQLTAVFPRETRDVARNNGCGPL